MKIISKQSGFMKVVLLAIVIIATLAYFNIDLRMIFESPIVQKFWNILIATWVGYLKPMFIYLWTSIHGLFN